MCFFLFAGSASRVTLVEHSVGYKYEEKTDMQTKWNAVDPMKAKK